jgi:hypothetical protein
MNTDERQVIDDLFDKLERVGREALPRDPDADNHIHARIARNPGAPYLMAQTLVAQQQALEEAYHRMQDLERQLEERPSGGFLDGLFSSARPRGRGHDRGFARQPAATYGDGYRAAYGQPQRGGFLGGAAQTAMGVAGGVVLGSMLASMLTPDAAAAAEPPADAGGEEDFSSADAGGDDFSF